MPAPADSLLFDSLRPCLAKVFERILQPRRDPVVVFVNLENMKWRGLLHLMCDKPAQLYMSLEQLTGQAVQSESAGGVLLYRAPFMSGKKISIGVYATEREQLVYALCGIRGVPMPLIKQVQAIPASDRYTVAYFGAGQLGVRHVSRDATVVESAPFVF
jgi:hypothetical protein